PPPSPSEPASPRPPRVLPPSPFTTRNSSPSRTSSSRSAIPVSPENVPRTPAPPSTSTIPSPPAPPSALPLHPQPSTAHRRQTPGPTPSKIRRRGNRASYSVPAAKRPPSGKSPPAPPH